jgi:hypothetical protein
MSRNSKVDVNNDRLSLTFDADSRKYLVEVKSKLKSDYRARISDDDAYRKTLLHCSTLHLQS